MSKARCRERVHAVIAPVASMSRRRCRTAAEGFGDPGPVAGNAAGKIQVGQAAPSWGECAGGDAEVAGILPDGRANRGST